MTRHQCSECGRWFTARLPNERQCGSICRERYRDAEEQRETSE